VVVWLAGSEIERFPGFGDYMSAVVDYNRLEVQHLKNTP